ncbi:TatD family hydrolase [Mycoplasma miroungirhinis]|uniref:TatD family hydrolase n=1 Tax=Mycoplasma miroungirhinis TaxID=754516 RepID=A0A6M4JDF5_9MOLU|nr:TatD family hydrolase [Mycoplasma miroungirhinis]QJR44355.1 TatD family hydrolase [Mycoplasma miroungirhinis]
MKYIDVHTHPFLEYYDNPIEVCKNWQQEEMKLLFMVGTNFENSKETIELSSKLDFVHPIIGIHPNESNGLEDGKKLEEIITKDVIAIGEIGLDYHYDDTPSKSEQLISLISQVEVAKKHNIPVMLHIRDAMEDAINFVSRDEYKNVTFIFHSFSGTKDDVEILLKNRNIYFSISGVVTFKNAQSTQEAVKNIPLERLFVETDTPYLAPVPMRGKENKSPNVKHTYKFIASLKNISENKLIEQVETNVEKVFKVKCK